MDVTNAKWYFITTSLALAVSFLPTQGLAREDMQSSTDCQWTAMLTHKHFESDDFKNAEACAFFIVEQFVINQDLNVSGTLKFTTQNGEIQTCTTILMGIPMERLSSDEIAILDAEVDKNRLSVASQGNLDPKLLRAAHMKLARSASFQCDKKLQHPTDHSR